MKEQNFEQEQKKEKNNNKERTLIIILFIIIILLLLFIFMMPKIFKYSATLLPDRWVYGIESNFPCDCECDNVGDEDEVTGSGEVSGTTTIEASNLDVKFDLSTLIIDGTEDNRDNIKVSNDGKNVTFKAVLEEPKDYLTFIIDIKNTNNMDIEISELITNTLTSTQSKYLKYSVTHANGDTIKVRKESNGIVQSHGEVIKAGESLRLKYTALYRDDFNTPLTTDLINVPFNCKIVFIQAD